MNKRIFVIGDIHGCFIAMKELIENQIQLSKDDKLIFLGDYIDRGSDSKKVLDYIMELQSNQYDIVTLRGNHESMLIDAWHNENLVFKWIQNGGSETLLSFGIDKLKNIDSRYMHFLENLKFYYELDKYIFVHAGFNDSIENPFTDKYSMLWNIREQYSNHLLIDRTVIHGHAPVPLNIIQKQIANNTGVINIDGGCVYTNARYAKLIALEVNTRTILIAE